jgi:hypothetical protein
VIGQRATGNVLLARALWQREGGRLLWAAHRAASRSRDPPVRRGEDPDAQRQLPRSGGGAHLPAQPVRAHNTLPCQMCAKQGLLLHLCPRWRAMCASRPFDANKTTNETGAWSWVAVPQSILLNGHGFYGDCNMLAGSNTVVAPKCNVTTQWVPPGRSNILPYAPATNPGAFPPAHLCGA